MRAWGPANLLRQVTAKRTAFPSPTTDRPRPRLTWNRAFPATAPSSLSVSFRTSEGLRLRHLGPDQIRDLRQQGHWIVRDPDGGSRFVRQESLLEERRRFQFLRGSGMPTRRRSQTEETGFCSLTLDPQRYMAQQRLAEQSCPVDLLGFFPELLTDTVLTEFLRQFPAETCFIDTLDINYLRNQFSLLRVFSRNGGDRAVAWNHFHGLRENILGFWGEVTARQWIIEERLPKIRKLYPDAVYIPRRHAHYAWMGGDASSIGGDACDGLIASFDATRNCLMIHEIYEVKTSRNRNWTRFPTRQIEATLTHLQRQGVNLFQGTHCRMVSVEVSPPIDSNQQHSAVMILANLDPKLSGTTIEGVLAERLEIDVEKLEVVVGRSLTWEAELRHQTEQFPASRKAKRRNRHRA